MRQTYQWLKTFHILPKAGGWEDQDPAWIEAMELCMNWESYYLRVDGGGGVAETETDTGIGDADAEAEAPPTPPAKRMKDVFRKPNGRRN